MESSYVCIRYVTVASPLSPSLGAKHDGGDDGNSHGGGPRYGLSGQHGGACLTPVCQAKGETRLDMLHRSNGHTRSQFGMRMFEARPISDMESRAKV